MEPPATAALLTRVTLVAAFACSACVSPAAVSGPLSSALVWPDPRSPGVEVATERSLRDDSKMNADKDLHSSTCFGGVVSSRGALGRPLEGTSIDVSYATSPVHRYTRTDALGAFHVCVARESRGIVVELLTGAARYTERTESAHLVFTRHGWSTKARDFILDTGDREKSLDVALDRDGSER